MVNLLFISNSSKIDAIKNILQPLLKVKIDIVTDFDFGLKEVFEKRPATVFIQDQIAGVTGESVARHIQMLLGSASPTFIFMHEGSTKAKPITGLFEYLIDLSLVEVKIVADIQATLKSILGSQWDRICIPPTIDRLAVRNAVAVPETSRAIADQLVDELLLDLGNSGICDQSTELSESISTENEHFHVESSTYDQLLELSSEISTDPSNFAMTEFTVNEDFTSNSSDPAQIKVITELDQQPNFLSHSESAISTAAQIVSQQQPNQKDISSVVPFIISNHDDFAEDNPSQVVSGNLPLQQVSPANFLIKGAERIAEDESPEDLLHVFEENYFSQSGRWKRYVIIIVGLFVCTGGGFWYLLEQKPHLLAYTSRPFEQSVVVATSPMPVEPAISIQKPVTAPAQENVLTAMPSFIPKTGLDSLYAVQNPGWERYVDTALEFRVYRNAGKIKALQVLGIKNNSISESKLKSMLIELFGDGDFLVKSREQKFGYHVSRALIGNKSELLIYRKKTDIRAFVVSFD